MRLAGRQLRNAVFPGAGAWRTVAAACLLLMSVGPQGCRAEQPWPLWQAYRGRFLETSGRIVDHSDNDRTTSEGQAYGMFFALVDNDRASFDKLLRWTEDNLADGDLTARLPAWAWGKTATGEWKPLDSNSAADADLWLAYDCLEAGRLWNDSRLSKLGSVLAERIAHREVARVAGLGVVLLPGPKGFQTDAAGTVLNLSYLPPQLLARLRLEQPSGPWAEMAQDLPRLIAAGAPAGFAMDWIRTVPRLAPSAAPGALAQGRKDAPATGSYDAVRQYLWLGLADRRTSGVPAELASLAGMGAYLAGNPLPPLEVQSDGKVLQAEGPVGFSAALAPYLDAIGRTNEARQQRDRLAASAQPDTGLYGRSTAYYDQNLSLFATGWQEGRFHFDRDGRLKVPWRS